VRERWDVERDVTTRVDENERDKVISRVGSSVSALGGNRLIIESYRRVVECRAKNAKVVNGFLYQLPYTLVPVIRLIRSISTALSNMAYKLPSLYAFSLPPDLLPSLQPRKLVIPTSHPLHPSNQSLPSTSVPSQDAQKKSDGAYVCTLTGASFSDLIGLKHHYKSDWYKYNVKLKLQGKKTPVGEDEFNNLVESTFALFPFFSLSFFENSLFAHLVFLYLFPLSRE